MTMDKVMMMVSIQKIQSNNNDESKNTNKSTPQINKN